MVMIGQTPPTTDFLRSEPVEERSPTPQNRRSSDKTTQQSPTLARRIDRDGSAMKERLPPPAMASGPLPPLPNQARSAPAAPPAAPRVRSPLPPLDRQEPKKQEHRLSQDWVHLNLSLDLPSLRGPVDRAKSTSPLLPLDAPTSSSSSSLPSRPRLPEPMMMPVKKTSPPRPSFERNQSEPLSPTRSSVHTRPEYRSRASLDHLRANDSSPTPPRTRKTSFSTPPQAMLDGAAEKDSNGGRMNMFRNMNSKMSTPPLHSRKSEDGLRRSEDMLRPSMDSYSKKELKAMQKEAQRNLGVATPPLVTQEKEREEGRKASGLSLKKSSGALKALFKSGKGKDKEATPSPPPMPQGMKVRSRPSTSEGASSSFGASSRPRPSLQEERSLWPSTSRSRTPGAATPEPRSVSDGRPSANGRESVPFPGRTSFSTERAMYPSHPRSTASRVSSDSSDRTRKPSRDLPPLPMPSPHEPKSFEAHQKEGEKKHSPLGEALPVSSLPYLSMMAGGSASGTESNPVTPGETSVAPVIDFTRTPPRLADTLGTTTPSPLFKPSKSLHLLSLPDLDLDFDLSFDKVNGSPSTPRRSPGQKRRTNPDSPVACGSPSRSASVSSPSRPTRRPSPVKRTTSERRRSQSFDGPGQDPNSWFNNGFDMSSKFASGSSSSAPLLSKPLEPSLMDEPRPVSVSNVPSASNEARQANHHEYSQSFSSQPSAPSSSDHVRTPSNASSTNETTSPSPPHTPDEEKSPHSGFGVALDTTPTPSGKAKSTTLGEPICLSRPPSIPLPAVPAATAIVTEVQQAVVEPIKSEKDKPELKQPRQCVRKLQSNGRIVKPEMPGNNKSLARDVDRRLLGFRYPSAGTTAVDRINMLKNELMPLLMEIDKRPFEAHDDSGNAALRSSMFEWSDALLFELQIEQTAHERGACLEALSAVMESSCLSERAMARHARDRTRFTKMMMRIVEFVMNKLGAKGVFHNTLLFSGRTLVCCAGPLVSDERIADLSTGVCVLPYSPCWRAARHGASATQGSPDALHPIRS